tara:strand:+ start:277 stop:513 length:237 start_codon:yes stop_codon:yes gene_type:complete
MEFTNVFENVEKSKYTKILKKEINGVNYFAVVWTKTNRVVSVYFQGKCGLVKVASFNEKNTKRLNAFKNLSIHFKGVA